MPPGRQWRQSLTGWPCGRSSKKSAVGDNSETAERVPKRFLAALIRGLLCYGFQGIRTANLPRTRRDEKDLAACQGLGALAAHLYSSVQRRLPIKLDVES